MNVLTTTLQLFSDGVYHGLTPGTDETPGMLREIIVEASLVEAYAQFVQTYEDYPGQAWFYATDPDMWVGGSETEYVVVSLETGLD
jgi:hypothetical protein